MACDGCTLDLTHCIIQFNSRTNAMKLLQDHGVIYSEIFCAKCQNPAILDESKLAWVCTRRQERIGKKKIGNAVLF